MNLKDRTWAEISLENIKFNYTSIKKHLNPNVQLLGIVKADAYGHGAIEVAHAIESIGCEYLAVATVSEALQLRDAGITANILILGCSSVEFTAELVNANIIQSISDYQTAKQMSDIACTMGKKLRVHLKVDTGMGRLGFTCRDGCANIDDILRVIALPGLDIEGIFTHFAVSEVYDSDYTSRQFKSFMRSIDEIQNRSGIRFRMRHCANSGAVCGHPDMQLDMVRPGIMLYGLYPGDDKAIPLRPAMQLKSKILHISDMEDGWTVSYGRKFSAQGKRRIAVVPVGYADGLHRCISGKIDMLVNGQRVHQVGNICMDMCMLDVTGVNASIGDIVTIFGYDGDEKISADEIALQAGTINYEILCAVSKRIPRIY